MENPLRARHNQEGNEFVLLCVSAPLRFNQPVLIAPVLLFLPNCVPLVYPNLVAKPLPRPEPTGQRKKAAGAGQGLQAASARKPRTFKDTAILVVLITAIGGLLIATVTGTLKFRAKTITSKVPAKDSPDAGGNQISGDARNSPLDFQNHRAQNIILARPDAQARGSSDEELQEMAGKFRVTTNVIRYQLEALGSTNFSEAGLAQFVESMAARFHSVTSVLEAWSPKNPPESATKREILNALSAGDLGAAELKMHELHSIARTAASSAEGMATNRRAEAVAPRRPSAPQNVRFPAAR